MNLSCQPDPAHMQEKEMQGKSQTWKHTIKTISLQEKGFDRRDGTKGGEHTLKLTNRTLGLEWN